jgi:hypothetical protein
MRLQKSIKIDDKEYTIRELTVEEIINLISKSNKSDDDGNPNESKTENHFTSILGQVLGTRGYIVEFLDIALPGTKVADLMKLAPSELMTLWDLIKEGNSHFFGVAQKLNLGETLMASVREIIMHFSTYAVSLSKQAMDEEFLDMATPSLSEPSTFEKDSDTENSGTPPSP